jgi:hypothetical protein
VAFLPSLQIEAGREGPIYTYLTDIAWTEPPAPAAYDDYTMYLSIKVFSAMSDMSVSVSDAFGFSNTHFSTK